MARPKETDEQKVKKVYKDAEIAYYVDLHYDSYYYVENKGEPISETIIHSSDAAWSNALTKIRKAKIKSAKDKRKPIKVPKEIKKHVGLTMYPSDKAMIVSGFGSVQKFLDKAIRDYKGK